MCSVITHIIFDFFLVAGIALSIAAFASPGWVKFHQQNSAAGPNAVQEEMYRGFFTCSTSGRQISNYGDFENCARDTWHTLKEWEKATFGCLLAGAAVGVIALFWSLILCCCLCCCECYVSFMLPVFAFCAFGVDLAALIIYGVSSNKDPPNLDGMTWQQFKELGYSIWIGVAATAAYFVDIFFGICLCCLLEKKSTTRPI